MHKGLFEFCVAEPGGGFTAPDGCWHEDAESVLQTDKGRAFIEAAKELYQQKNGPSLDAPRDDKG